MPDLTEEVRLLKVKEKAVILSHYYQQPEVQEAADYVGDSLGLARMAQKAESPVIVMCGVYFMAETAALLNPDKVVLIPDKDAGCPLAEFATASIVKEWRKRYPEHTFVAYVNSSAEVKALSDICCTSSNAVQIVRKLANDKIVFLPDKNLGAYVQKLVPEKEIILWPGYCVVHENADLQKIIKAKNENPDALIIAHPECRNEVLEIADGICSTGQMVDFVNNNMNVRKFIIVTERGMIHSLRKNFKDKIFIEPGSVMQCANMKKITIQKLYDSLLNKVYRVSVSPETAGKARESIEKMLFYSA